MRLKVWSAALLSSLIACQASARVWTDDDTGQQSIEAEFVSLEGEVASFRLPDGGVRRCAFDRLSTQDRELIAGLVITADGPLDEEASNAGPGAEPATSAAVEPAQMLTAAHEAASPTPETYECTVMVPKMVTEMRTITVCEWRNEQRQSTYTACRMVPETHEVSYEYTVPTYETRTREFVYSVFKPVVSSHEREYTVMVPHTEKRQGTRRECHMVPVEMTRTVCEDHGSWQQVVRHSGCDCCGCSRTWACKVWVPKMEQREVKYTVMRPQMRDVPCEYQVTVCKPEKRTETVQVCNYVAQQQKRSVPYTVCVPVKKTGTREVTTYRRVEEQKTHTYTVRVPYQVEKQVPVRVCRMVPKKVKVQAAPCGPASCWCGRRCW